MAENKLAIVQVGKEENQRLLWTFLLAQKVKWCNGHDLELPVDPILTIEPSYSTINNTILLSNVDVHSGGFYLQTGLVISQAPWAYFLREHSYDTTPKFTNAKDFIASGILQEFTGIHNTPGNTYVPPREPTRSELVLRIQEYEYVVQQLLESMPYDLDEHVVEMKRLAKRLLAVKLR